MAKAPQVRSYPASGLNLNDLVNSLTMWFGAQQIAVIPMPQPNGMLLQVEHASKGRKLLGMSSSLNVSLAHVDDVLTVQIGEGNFINQAASMGIGAALFLPLAATAAFGIWQQSTLDDKTFAFIQQQLAALSMGASV